MERGSFYAYVPQRNLSRFLPLKKNKDKAVHERLDKVHALSSARSWHDEDGRPTRVTFDAGSAREGALQDVNNASSNPTDFLVAGGGLVVVRASVCTPEHPVPCAENTYPAVYCTNDTVVVFSGRLRHIEELFEDSTNGLLFEYDEGEPGGLAGAQMRNDAEVIYHLYKRAGKSTKDDLLVMLSELQGRFAFVVYDALEHCVFAARDPSGEMSLCSQVDGDGGIAITNSMGLVGVMEAEGGHGCGDAPWQEIPAGHFTVGRHQRPTQFALNSRQLETRREAEDGGNPSEEGSLPSTPHDGLASSTPKLSSTSSFKAGVEHLFDRVSGSLSGSLSRKSSGHHTPGELGGLGGFSEVLGAEPEGGRRGSREGGNGPSQPGARRRSASSDGSEPPPGGEWDGGDDPPVSPSSHRPTWDVQLPPMSDCVEWSAPKGEDEIDRESWRDGGLEHLAPGVSAMAS